MSPPRSLELANAPVPIREVDARGVIAWANRAELELLGYPEDEYVGRPLAQFLIDPAIADDLLGAGGAHDREVRMRAKDGSTRYVVVASSALDAGGARAFSRDVTARKHDEQTNERRINELTRTVRLNEMFASVLGHDLRNPLNTIMMAAQMVLGRVDDPNAARPLQRLLDSASRMQRMIEQLLDFSRARTVGGIPLERAPMDLAVLVRDAIEEIRVARPEIEIAIAMHGDVRGDWDTNRLAQVFSNLIGNAVQHGPTGARVEVAIDGTAAGTIRIAISNRGTIPSDLLPILFAPFRGTHQRSAKSHGLGLGLFITNQVIQAHGGEIDASSADGITTFAIRLPRRASISATNRTSFDAQPARAARLEAPSHAPRSIDDVLRLLVKGIRDYAIFMLDAHGYIISWNTGAQLIKGYTAEEAIGQHFSIFYPLDEVQAGKCARELTIAARDGQYEELGWRLRKDGTPFWAHVSITAIRDHEAKLVGFAKVTRDLTDELQIKELARQGEERFRLLVDGVKDYAIFMLDPDGRVSTWNAGAERINGYRADEIIGEHFSSFYSNADLIAGKPDRELIVAASEGRFEDEGWRLRKDGTLFWANVVISALYAPGGRLLGFAKVTRDLTERRLHEEERVRLAQAHEALRLRDEFLSIASHELKTPLTTMRLELDALRVCIGDADRSVLNKLERTHRAGERLSELVDRLLDVSMIAGGRLELRTEQVELTAIVREIVDRIRAAADVAGCELRCALADGVTGLWDRSWIDQAITNLLANAIKYAAGQPIDIALVEQDSLAILEIRDHGPGLPPGREAQLFERFERGASMRHYGGLGLGLYVVGQIAAAHGGSATAANAPGGGACFRFALPLQRPTKATPA